jgi:hypothetical protein
MQVPLTIINKGPASVRNLAVRICLPRTLVPPLAAYTQEIGGDMVRFEVVEHESPNHLMVTYYIPTLRVDEPGTLQIPLRIDPEDWITVKTAGPHRGLGQWTVSDLGATAPIKLIGIRVKVTAHADNTRVHTRVWELWITRARNLDALQGLAPTIITVARIWRHRHRAYRLPFFSGYVFLPFPLVLARLPLFKQFQRICLSYFEPGLVQGYPRVLSPAAYILSGSASRVMLANPGDRKREFRAWIRDIYAARPPYFQ